jgi:GDPmannose 4,6-dehydratase
VRDLVARAFAVVGLDWQEFVRTDPKFLRPAEVQELVADTSLAQELLGWQPQTGFDALIEEMVAADLEIEGSVGSTRPVARSR